MVAICDELAEPLRSEKAGWASTGTFPAMLVKNSCVIADTLPRVQVPEVVNVPPDNPVPQVTEVTVPLPPDPAVHEGLADAPFVVKKYPLVPGARTFQPPEPR